MKYKMLGKSDIKISEITLGCWVMGGDYWGGAQDNESISAIKSALDNGINFFDTAELYGNGRSEEVLGRGLKGYRDKVHISTKVWKSHMSKENVIKACEDSLKRLKTDYIDVYFIHYPPDDVPIEETMESMLKLKKSGKIRAIGLSNFSLEQMKHVSEMGRYEVIQPCYSLLWRFIDKDIIPYCIENQISVIPYSPLAQGLLTGKFSKETKFSEEDWRSNAPIFQGKLFLEALEVVDNLKPFAKKYGKSIGQLAINWTNSVPGITSAIVGARNENQLKENIGAAGWSIDKRDFEDIEMISRKFTERLLNFETFFSSKIAD